MDKSISMTFTVIDVDIIDSMTFILIPFIILSCDSVFQMINFKFTYN